MKKNKIRFFLVILFIAFLISAILLLFKSKLLPAKQTIHDVKSALLFSTADIKNPSYLFWQNNDSLLVVTDQGEIYQISDSVSLVSSIDKNSLLGIKSNELITCETKNYEISSPEQIASKIIIKNLSNQEIITQVETTESITPLSCALPTFYAMPAYYFLEEQFFIVNADSIPTSIEQISTIPSKEYNYTDNGILFTDDYIGKSATLITDDSFDLKDFAISDDEHKIALILKDGGVIIFRL